MLALTADAIKLHTKNQVMADSQEEVEAPHFLA